MTFIEMIVLKINGVEVQGYSNSAKRWIDVVDIHGFLEWNADTLRISEKNIERKWRIKSEFEEGLSANTTQRIEDLEDQVKRLKEHVLSIPKDWFQTIHDLYFSQWQLVDRRVETRPDQRDGPYNVKIYEIKRNDIKIIFEELYGWALTIEIQHKDTHIGDFRLDKSKHKNSYAEAVRRIEDILIDNGIRG